MSCALLVLSRKNMVQVFFPLLYISQFQLRPAPPGYCGHLSTLSVPGVGRVHCAARGPGICQVQGQPRAFDTYAVPYQNITTQRILLEKQADWLICQGWEKIEEVC